MKLKVAVFVTGMLFTGTINTITTKYQDLTVVGHEPDGRPRTFKHPAVQSAFMFFGEALCLIPFFLMEWGLANEKSRIRRRTELKRRGATFRLRRVLVFAVPAMCDAVGTTLVNVGLYFTYASTYQMLRGTLVLFAGMFTILILRRMLYLHHWLGMVLITGGAALVGAASVMHAHTAAPSEAPTAQAAVEAVLGGGRRLLSFLVRGSDPGVDAASAPLFGDLCVVGAQAFTALQFILEEKFVSHYRVPTLLAVGLEGVWGLLLCCVALPLMANMHDRSGLPIDDGVQAMREVFADGSLTASVVVSIVAIGVFNFCGISVTKALSGAARATIDACRTLFIWLVALWLGWEKFLGLQVVGFAVLFAGTSLYNELIRTCLPRRHVEEEDDSGSSGTGSESGYESDTEAPPRQRQAKDDGEGGITQPLLQADAAAAASAPRPARPAVAAAAGGVEDGLAAAIVGSATSGAISTSAPSRAHQPPHHHHHHRNHRDSDEYTMARSMRLGHSTLSPHALEDTDADTEAQGASFDGPRVLSYDQGGAPFMGPDIPEGDEASASTDNEPTDPRVRRPPPGSGSSSMAGQAAAGDKSLTRR